MEEKLIYFTDIELTGINEVIPWVASNYLTLYNDLQQENQVICQNPKEDMMFFFQNFSFIEAAGGLVNHKGDFLFIKRNGFWDIPKGKMESNETSESAAIREIQEECGISGKLIIRKKIIETYHTYEFKNKSILKKTHWYCLEYIGDNSTKPQLEEGITEIQWLPQNQFSTIESNTYPSILDVLAEIRNS